MVGEVSIDIVIVIYVDNILVGSKDVESHVKELNMVIHALTKAGFKLKPSKCKIAYLAIQFMGAVVDGDQRGVCPLKAEVFAKMQRPRTGKEVQKVLGFVNFLRDFIPLYSCVVGPLEGSSSHRYHTAHLFHPPLQQTYLHIPQILPPTKIQLQHVIHVRKLVRKNIQDASLEPCFKIKVHEDVDPIKDHSVR